MTTGADEIRSDLNRRDDTSKTAVSEDRKDNYTSRDKYGKTHLIREIESGNTPAVEALLANIEIDPNLQDKYDRSHLHAAVAYGHQALVKILVEKSGVDPNLRNERGQSPLWVATSLGYKAIVQILLDCGRVDPETRDEDGQTPLSAATVQGMIPMLPIRQGVPSLEGVVEVLLASGRADPDAQDSQGLTPLAWASRGHYSEARTKIVEMLLRSGKADPNLSDNLGVTPLMWSDACCNYEIKKMLLESCRMKEGLKENIRLDIDSRYITHWITSCNAQHEGRCEPTPPGLRLPHQIPGWVIDLAQGCLVPGHAASRYIALSYVWSNKDEYDYVRPSIRQQTNQRVLLRKSNLSDFQKPGYIQEHVAMKLPAAVQDAMVLVQKLGERYLWVDCLCIVQDDEKTREQVDHMGDIYSGAYLTIIAATSSGKLGYHFPHAEKRRTEPQDLYEHLYASKWATRGWTFQEQMLSKRAVVFTWKHTFWECQRCVWSMNGPRPELATDTSFARPHYERARRMSSDHALDFSSYIEMISLYNSRDLTYPQDILAAFSGVLNTLTQNYPSGFVCGLPQTYLDIALLWQPFEIAQRRVINDGGSIAASRNLPSWSWCGWKCPVDPFHLRTRSTHFSINEGNENFQKPIWKAGKLVKWYSLPEDMHCQSLIDCPSTSTDGVSMKHQDDILRDIARQCVHGSQDLENDRSTCGCKILGQTRSPMPPDTNVFSPQNTWPFLSCETSQAFLRIEVLLRARLGTRASIGGMVFKIRQFASGPSQLKGCDLICLADKKGRRAGVLRCMDDTAVNTGNLIELIAISTGFINGNDVAGDEADKMYKQRMESYAHDSQRVEALEHRKPLKYDFGTLPYSTSDYLELKEEMDAYGIEGPCGQEYHFYNVLWIERRGQIAYRRAAGRVPKRVWDADCSPPMKVILG